MKSFYLKYISLNFYIVSLLSLVWIKEYFTLVSIAPFLLTLFLKSEAIFLFFTLPLLLFYLATLFMTMHYFLYFINLVLFLGVVFIKKSVINLKQLYSVAILFFFELLFFFISDSWRYELYLESGLVQQSYPFFLDVALLLTLLHLVLIGNIGIIKKKYF